MTFPQQMASQCTYIFFVHARQSQTPISSVLSTPRVHITVPTPFPSFSSLSHAVCLIEFSIHSDRYFMWCGVCVCVYFCGRSVGGRVGVCVYCALSDQHWPFVINTICGAHKKGWTRGYSLHSIRSLSTANQSELGRIRAHGERSVYI